MLEELLAMVTAALNTLCRSALRKATTWFCLYCRQPQLNPSAARPQRGGAALRVRAIPLYLIYTNVLGCLADPAARTEAMLVFLADGYALTSAAALATFLVRLRAGCQV
jgi:hypothetical protein